MFLKYCSNAAIVKAMPLSKLGLLQFQWVDEKLGIWSLKDSSDNVVCCFLFVFFFLNYSGIFT